MCISFDNVALKNFHNINLTSIWLAWENIQNEEKSLVGIQIAILFSVVQYKKKTPK